MKFRELLMRIKGLGATLIAVERVVLTVAGLSGLLAFWQYWDEREERRIERIASTVSALSTCRSLHPHLANLAASEEEMDKLVRGAALGANVKTSTIAYLRGSTEPMCLSLELEALKWQQFRFSMDEQLHNPIVGE